jgi:hypothetical protein
MEPEFAFLRMPCRHKAAGMPHDGPVHAAEAVRDWAGQ